jgi:hypothetical protein
LLPLVAFFDRLDTLISGNPLSSLLLFMFVCGLPAPSRIDEQEQAEERREREFILNAPPLFHN